MIMIPDGFYDMPVDYIAILPMAIECGLWQQGWLKLINVELSTSELIMTF